MPAPAAAPPVAPPPPAASPSPAPSPAAPPAPSGDSFSDAFPEGDDSPPPAPAPAPAKPAAAVPAQKPADKPPVPAPKPGDKPPVEPPPTTNDEPPMAGNVRQFRQWGQQQHARAKELQGKVGEMEAKIRELESRPAESKSVEAMAAQLKQAETRLAEYEQSLQVTRYERSQEYKEKFQQPFEQAVQRAYSAVKTLTVKVTDPTTGDVTERAATDEDFNEIYALPTLAAARRLAREKFGDDWDIAAKHYESTKDLSEKAFASVQEHKAKGSELEKTRTAQATQQQLQQQEIRVKTFESAKKWFEGKEPDYAQKDGDQEWNDALAKGRELSNRAFTADRSKLDVRQVAAMDAQVYHRAAAFPAMKQQVSKLTAQLAELQKTVEELRESGPGKPTAGGGAPDASEKTGAEGFDAHFPK